MKNRERGEWTGEEKKAALLGFTLVIVQILFFRQKHSVSDRL